MPPRKTTGRPRTTSPRAVFDAILYIATTGCQWRMLPNDFPPVSTVRGYFHDWRDNGLLHEMNRHLVAAARRAEGRAADPSAGVIDSQSVKTPESGAVRGDDAAKRTNGRKRHIVTDTIGLLVGLAVHGANIQNLGHDNIGWYPGGVDDWADGARLAAGGSAAAGGKPVPRGRGPPECKGHPP